MDKLNSYSQMGICFELLAHSDTHKNYSCASYLDTEICPANWLSQLRIYFNDAKIPVAFVTWAEVSQETEKELIDDSRALYHQDWNAGDNLYFNDFVAPWGGVRDILKDLTSNIFTDREAFSLSRHSDGKVKKKHRWIGKAFIKKES
ncbi:MAG: toxin-activating lysine-acyltransferase [Oceanospirillaceae bacterium]|nr:toxin-activating lysine-acyltransferase [Oceanospirillaceae bacterium]